MGASLGQRIRSQGKSEKSVLLIIDYFGKWPPWFDMFLKSCGTNPSIDWLINTDCPIPRRHPANVKFRATSFGQFCERVSDTLEIRFKPDSPYNICNVRPAYGEIYEQEIGRYDYFGWSDLDVIYGDIRRFYDASVLERNVISSHRYTCSGHFTLIKNEPWLRHAFRHIRGWKERLEDPGEVPWHQCLDEAHLSALFSPTEWIRSHLNGELGTRAPEERFWSNNHFKERWTTPFLPTPWLGKRPNSPETWYWKQGRLTTCLTGNRQFIYLHLMNFKSKRWVNEALYGNAQTWGDRTDLMDFAYEDDIDAVRIDRTGIHAMEIASSR